MANNMKKSFGKNLLRMSSMLIVLVMLISTLFTGAVAESASTDYVVKLTAGAAWSKSFFGQKVGLEANKTYAFTYYYSNEANNCVLRIDDGSYTDLTADFTTSDSDWKKITAVFTVPSTIADNADGKKPFWVGMQGPNLSSESYYYGFKLYDLENPDVNLLVDADFTASESGFSSVWRKPSSSLQAGYYSKVTLAEAGGIEIFQKTDADRHVLTLAPNSKGMPYFGQRVSLVPGETYVFTNYFLPGTSPNQVACFPDLTEIASEIITDSVWSKQSIKFTVPTDAATDENGKVLVFVGFRGNYSATPLYWYGLNLYKENNPEINLLLDSDLTGAEFQVKADTWKTPSGNYINSSTNPIYTEVSLESIGGIGVFLSYEGKCDLTGDGNIDIRDLVRMKRFSVGTVESLLDGRGDLNGDKVFGNADDLILLKQEILK